MNRFPRPISPIWATAIAAASLALLGIAMQQLTASCSVKEYVFTSCVRLSSTEDNCSEYHLSQCLSLKNESASGNSRAECATQETQYQIAADNCIASSGCEENEKYPGPATGCDAQGSFPDDWNEIGNQLCCTTTSSE